MPKALDCAYVTYQVPDLDRMEGFLLDFGLARASRTGSVLYMRGAGTEPFVHQTVLGPEALFLGGAFTVGGRADLEQLARLPGASSIEPIDGPGGGLRVRMTTPDGVAIDAVAGRTPAAPLELRDPHPFNAGMRKERRNTPLRPKREPGQVLRLGHFVLRVTDHDASVAWFQERFGLVAADHFCVPGDESRVIGSFLRCDRGAAFVDHHSILVVQAPTIGVHHCSFEMQDLDAVMGAHDYLASRGHRLDCGVGRHLLGSQIFDYWRDPFGFRLEHFTDGDVANDEHRPGRFAGTADQTTQWGMNPPPDFFE